MRIQLLISTMHQADYSLLERMNVATDAVVINQCDREDKKTIEYNGHRILWIDTTERGLSKSRNMAVRNATADICLIADDDMEYRSDYVDTVTSAFSRIDADIIGFQVCGIERKYKNYPQTEQRITYLKSMRVSSVEVACKRTAFERECIVFDELIGAGTEFLMGEESAMLFQCLSKGLTACFTPVVIADLHIGNSSWFSGWNEKFFVGKGAAFAAMARYATPPVVKGLLAMFFIWQFAFRKQKLYKDKISVLKAVKLMQAGKKAYLIKRRDKK